MSYLDRLKHLETHQWPTDKTDKTTFVSSVSSMQARIERATSIQQAGAVAVTIPSNPAGALLLDPAAKARRRQAASEVAAIVPKDVTSDKEREVVDWLERIHEDAPVIYRETLVKCRTSPDGLRFFLDLARDVTGTVN